MANMFDIQSKRGSIWHRWDPHIPTPGTALNDQYAGPDPWAALLNAIEASNPPIRAIGITDSFGIERYEQVVDEKRRGRVPGVGLIFPNVELRLGIESAKKNTLIAVAGGEKDGTSGLRDATASFAAQRKSPSGRGIFEVNLCARSTAIQL